MRIRDHQDSLSLQYFFHHAPENKVYRWTYFAPSRLYRDRGHPPGSVVDQLETITTWNYAIVHFDDPGFWQTYVLAKNESGSYKYLLPVK